jgi:hypothetical protein
MLLSSGGGSFFSDDDTNINHSSEITNTTVNNYYGDSNPVSNTVKNTIVNKNNQVTIKPVIITDNKYYREIHQVASYHQIDVKRP